MKLKQFATSIMLAIAVFSSCSKKDSTPSPAASFYFNGNMKAAPATVTFTNTSSNATSAIWDFGDGASSTDFNPTHLYTKGGSYTVKLTAFNNSAQSNNASQTVTVANAYTKVSITSMSITGISTTGTYNIYFKFVDGSNNVLWTSTNVAMNSATLPLNVNISTPYVFTNLSSLNTIQIWKASSLGSLFDTQIATTAFNPGNYNTGATAYPATITPTSVGIIMSLNLLWQ